jgi:ribosome-binding factor A
MADGRTRSRMAPPNFRNLCDELDVEDGADPRVFFRRGGRHHTHRSRRLCGAVQRTLSLCLASVLGADAAHGLSVESVEPAASPGWLRVVLRADRVLDPTAHRRLAGTLDSARGALRTEIGAAVPRRRVPDLTFLVLGPEEARS